MPLFAYVKALEESSSGSAEEASKQLNHLIATAEKNALTVGHSMREFHAGLFPVVAWADEQISRITRWESSLIWQRFLLQKQYFKTTVAGIEFFQRLEALETEDEGVRELYLLCLCMGFLGRYSTDPQAIELSKLRETQYYLLNDSGFLISASDSPLLFPFAYKLNSTQQGLSLFLRRLWSIVKTIFFYAAPPVIIVLLMMALDQKLSESVDQFYQLISK
jgi:type VI secretion system protein ImpK